MVLFVPTSEVLKDGNVGLPPITSVIFHLIRSRSQSTCSVCLMKLILLLQFLTRSTASTGALQLAGLSKIFNHPLVASLVSASQRILGRRKVKKDFITPEMLKALVGSKITDKSHSLSDLRSYALLVPRDFFALASYVIQKPPMFIVLIALGLDEPPLRIMPVSLIDFSSDITVGRARTPRMATLRMILILVCQSRSL